MGIVEGTMQSVAQRGESAASRAKTRMPHLPPGLVDRVDLRSLLDRASRGAARVVVITGPPGAGKTTLLADWGRHVSDVGWVTLQEGDSPYAVWDAVVAAVADVVGLQAAEHLRPENGVDAEFIAVLARVIAEVGRPVRLVLDEVEHLRDPAVLRTVDLLLNWAPSLLCVVLAGRVEPPLAFGRLRLAARLRELRARDLCFTPSDAAQLLATHGVQLGHAGLQTVMERTEGWAAGLRLAAMSLENADDPDTMIAEFAVDERAVADYLMGELLSRQPARVRDFLLATCICDELSPELAVELSGRDDAGEVLAALCRSNALTHRLEAPAVRYRYHAMLRGYLLAELRRRGAPSAPDLHRKAARWYAGRSEEQRAFAHAVQGRDGQDIAELVARSGLGLVLSGQDADVTRLLGAAPQNAAVQTPVGLVVAAAALQRGDTGNADVALRAVASGGGDVRTTGLAVTLQVQRRWLDGDLVGAASLMGDLRETGDPDVDMLTSMVAGSVRLQIGDATGADTDLIRSLTLATARRRHHLVTSCLSIRAAVAVASGDLVEARRRADDALRHATDHGLDRTPACGHAHLAAAVAAYRRLDSEGVARHLPPAQVLFATGGDASGRHSVHALLAATAFDSALSRGAPSRDDDRRNHAATVRAAGAGDVGPLTTAFLAPLQQRICLDIGEVGWAGEAVTRAAEQLGDAAEVAYLQAAQLAHRGRLDTALRLLRAVSAERRTYLDPVTLIDAGLLEAVSAEASGDPHRSRSALLRAVRLAAPSRVLRPFRDGGRAVRGLLIHHHNRFGRDNAFVAAVLDEVPAVVTGPIERLSEREHDVLVELYSLATVEEVAARLGVSTNTVKTHLRSISRKLDVGSRRAAVTTARRLALL